MKKKATITDILRSLNKEYLRKKWLIFTEKLKNLYLEHVIRKWQAILGSLALIAALVGIGAYGWFSDVETSNNTFTAGSLNLVLDSNSGNNVIKWNIGPMVPGNQPKGTFSLANTGTIEGYLDFEDIVVTDFENGIIEPEAEAGDITDLEGELQNIMDLKLFHDLNCDGLVDTDDNLFFDDKVGKLASHYELNLLIPANGNVCISGIFDWRSTLDDNQAMTDSFELDITFQLGQRPEQ